MARVLPEDFSLLCELRSSKPSSLTADTLRYLKYSVLQDKYSVYRDQNDAPRGYVAWADISLETLVRIAHHGRYPRYLYEWNEGRVRLFLDVLMHRQIGDISTAEVIARLTRDADFVAYERRGKFRVLAKCEGCFVPLNLDRLSVSLAAR